MTPWRYNERPDGFTLPSYGLDEEAHEELTERIWSSLVMGDDSVEDFVDLYLDEDEEDQMLSEDQVRQAFELCRQARLAQQAQWTQEETLTNLDRAFDALNDTGIVARQHFTCCGTCGAAEIDDERDDSRHWRGYVFFHQQDTPGLVHDGSVYLAYGIFPPEDFDPEVYERMPEQEQTELYLADLRNFVESEVVPRLTEHGLQVEWNGDHRTRVLVSGAQWYMPLAS